MVAKPKSSLESLPTETLQAILSHLPNIASLPRIALTCTTFYHAYTSASSLIITQILLNQVGRGVLPEALATRDSRLVSYRGFTIDLFASKHLRTRRDLPKNWTWAGSLKDALAISSLHEHVTFF